MTCYRGTALTPEQFETLNQSKEHAISMNGYLSTSRDFDQAVAFCDHRKTPRDQIQVLFEIECDVKELGSSVICADIEAFSKYAYEKEVLFDLNTCFVLNSIERQKDKYLIKMSVCNEGGRIQRDYMSSIERQTAEKSAQLALGKLLCDLGQYEQAEKHFIGLLAEPNGEDMAWIEFNLGRTYYFQGRWGDAKKYYNRAYDRMMEVEPTRVKDSIHVINNMGGVFKRQGNLDEAMKYYQKALKLREKHVPDDCIGIASCLVNIGDVLDDQGKFHDAMKKYRDALDIQQKVYPSGHIDTAGTLNNIGNIYYRFGEYGNALKHYEQALEMRKKSYPEGHSQIAASLNNIGTILRIQKHYEEALETHKRALDIRKKFYRSGHVSIGDSLNNIAVCYEDQNDRRKAVEYYEKALEVYEKFLPEKHTTRTKIENSIRRIKKSC